jgi:hypothetical protein
VRPDDDEPLNPGEPRLAVSGSATPSSQARGVRASRLSRLGVVLRRRPRQVFVVVGASSSGVAILAVAYLMDPDNTQLYWQSLFLTVGSTVLLALVVYGIAQGAVVALRESTTTERPRLDVEEYINMVRRCSQHVMILDTCTELLEPWYSKSFLKALEEALMKGATFELFILNPNSDAARRRTDEVNGLLDVPKVIMGNLLSLMRWKEERAGALYLDRLNVYICEQPPQIQVYQWDDRAVVSFHTEGLLSAESPQIETHVKRTPWGGFVDKRRSALLADVRTIPLMDYWARPIRATLSAGNEIEVRVNYVTINEVPYVRNERLVDIDAIQTVTAHLVMRRGDPPTEYRLTWVKGDERETVNNLFYQKYGRQYEVYFRLDRTC